MNQSSRGCDQTGVSLPGSLQGGRKNRRIQEQLHKALLVFDGKVNDLGFVDGPVCGLLSGGNHKIADTAALKFRGPSDDAKRIGRNASFDTRRAASLLGHD
jgi:hypothetical protein